MKRRSIFGLGKINEKALGMTPHSNVVSHQQTRHPKFISEILKQYKMSQQDTSYANLYASAIQQNKGRKCAFTLAEVLITLTIIGVIAALTIPNLIHKWHQKQYEARFQKTYAHLSQIIERMQVEEGENFYDKYVNVYKQLGHYGDFTTALYTYLNVNNKPKKQLIPKTYNNVGKIHGGFCDSHVIINNTYSICTTVNSSVIHIIADTNTYLQGPNMFGYDVFIFAIDAQNKLIGYPNHTCSNYANVAGNGYGCARYALTNKCPDDTTKTYWECLK